MLEVDTNPFGVGSERASQCKNTAKSNMQAALLNKEQVKVAFIPTQVPTLLSHQRDWLAQCSSSLLRVKTALS